MAVETTETASNHQGRDEPQRAAGSSDRLDTAIPAAHTPLIPHRRTPVIDLAFDKEGGLVPAIAQDAETSEILMLGYLSPESWRRTLESGIAHYHSRSRNRIWKKGESSGNVQEVREIRVDCDADCVLLKVRQVGEAACHTGYRSCFYRVVRGDTLEIDGSRVFDPEDVYGGAK
jgi:phosphoribosyl-AMP cyclohydrolase